LSSIRAAFKGRCLGRAKRDANGRHARGAAARPGRWRDRLQLGFALGPRFVAERRVQAQATAGCSASATIDAYALTPAVLAFMREAA
jgi:hypothetical protein